jgi:hypothetical protein
MLPQTIIIFQLFDLSFFFIYNNRIGMSGVAIRDWCESSVRMDPNPTSVRHAPITQPHQRCPRLQELCTSLFWYIIMLSQMLSEKNQERWCYPQHRLCGTTRCFVSALLCLITTRSVRTDISTGIYNLGYPLRLRPMFAIAHSSSC